MEEKRLECLMTLQIHRSDTSPSIDAVIDRFATTAAERLLNFFYMNVYVYQCTQFLNTKF